jgi:hypothetical protein
MRCHECNLSGGAPQPLAHCDMKVPGLCCSSPVVLDAPHHRCSCIQYMTQPGCLLVAGLGLNRSSACSCYSCVAAAGQLCSSCCISSQCWGCFVGAGAFRAFGPATDLRSEQVQAAGSRSCTGCSAALCRQLLQLGWDMSHWQVPVQYWKTLKLSCTHNASSLGTFEGCSGNVRTGLVVGLLS